MKHPPPPLSQRIRVRRTGRVTVTNGVRTEGFVFSVGPHMTMLGELRIPGRGVPYVHVTMGVGIPESNISLAELTDALQIAAARDLGDRFSPANAPR